MRPLLRIFAFLAVLLFALGCSEENQSVCDRAWELWCECPGITCQGNPTSCTGPDRTWAECIVDLPDPCAGCPS